MNKSLVLACEGKSESQGGLNLSDLRDELSKIFPDQEDKIRSMTRKSLLGYCKRSSNINKEIKKSKDKYFRPGSPLNSRQKSYCRCIKDLSSKGKVYNPYAVCTKATHRTGRFKCAPYYDYDNMTKEEVAGLAKLKGLSVSEMKKLSYAEYKKSPNDPRY